MDQEKYRRKQSENNVRLLRLMGDPILETVVGFNDGGDIVAVDAQKMFAEMDKRLAAAEKSIKALQNSKE